MVTETKTKIRVDANELTLAEHAEAAEIAAASGHPLDAPGGQFYSVAAMAFLVQRRTDPTFTYEQALALKMGDLEMVNNDEEKARAVNNGGAPQPSPESGT